MMATAKSSKIIGILGSLFVVLSIGLSISVATEDDPKGREIGRDGHYIAYASGVVWDTKAGLEWVSGPDRNTMWDEAMRWVDNLTVAAGGWRMPTADEVKTLYEKGRGTRNMTPLLETTGWYVWSEETKDSSSAWGFYFLIGYRVEEARGASSNFRAFAVRSRK